MSDTEGDEPRAPGWYPDPREPGRHRHWDGTRWSELSATAPMVTDEGPVVSAPAAPSRRPILVLAAAAAVVLLVALGAWVALGGDSDGDADQDTAAARSTTTADPAPAPGDGASTTTTDPGVATTSATDGTTTTSGGDPAAPCTVDDGELLGLLRAHPPLASLADGLTVEQVRCAGDWASAVVAAADTDQSLAVFRNDGSGWTLVLVGSAEPCSGLGIPTEAESALGCGEW